MGNGAVGRRGLTDSFILAEFLEATRNNIAVPARPTRVGAFHVRPLGDGIFNLVTLLLTLVGLSVLVGLAIALVIDSAPSLKAFGWGFVISTEWDPVNDRFGALPFIYGTLVSSALALVIAVPLSLGVALCLSEMVPAWLSQRLGFMVELLAAIPSVVYGLWAVFVLGPWLRDHVEPLLGATLGFLPLFRGPRVSVSILARGWYSRSWWCRISPPSVPTSSVPCRRPSARLRWL